MNTERAETEHGPIDVEAARDLDRAHLADRHERRGRDGEHDRDDRADDAPPPSRPAPAATLDARGAAPIARSTARSSGSERSCRLSASPTSTRHAKNAMAPNSVSAMDSGRTACWVWKVVTDVTRKNCGLPGSRRLT